MSQAFSNNKLTEKVSPEDIERGSLAPGARQQLLGQTTAATAPLPGTAANTGKEQVSRRFGANNDRLRIAQVAPLAEAVPPLRYGGTERVVSWLTEELVAQGHDVTLFASGGSQTAAKLVTCAQQGLRLSGINNHTAHNIVMLDKVRRRASEFDIIHYHTDLLQFAPVQDIQGKSLTTLHGRLDLADARPVYETFTQMPLVSISNDQRRAMPEGVDWLSTIYHGLPPSVCPFNPYGGDYLAFLGRISPEKRPDRAIAIALAAGLRIKLAAKIDEVDRSYFEAVVRPLLDNPLVDFIGEIDETEKSAFLGNAIALVFPIDWPEPFGLVMIEAMSAGTPTIAWKNGSVSEVIAHGRSGFIVESMEEAIQAALRAKQLSRHDVRQEFEKRFTAGRMARNYIAGYQALLRRKRTSGLQVGSSLVRAVGLSAPHAVHAELPGQAAQPAATSPAIQGTVGAVA